MVNTFKLFSLVAFNTLELRTGDSYFKSTPTNNNTSASSTPVILLFIRYELLKSGFSFKLSFALISKLSESNLFIRSFRATIVSQSENSPIIAPI